MEDREYLEYQIEVLKEELEQSKAEHTMDKARVVYAYHILNAGRDEHVLMHMDDKKREVTFWKMKYDQLFAEVEHYKKSNKAWQEKYEKLFEKNKITLGAIEELEKHIDQCSCRRGIKRCCK